MEQLLRLLARAGPVMILEIHVANARLPIGRGQAGCIEPEMRAAAQDVRSHLEQVVGDGAAHVRRPEAGEEGRHEEDRGVASGRAGSELRDQLTTDPVLVGSESLVQLLGAMGHGSFRSVVCPAVGFAEDVPCHPAFPRLVGSYELLADEQ
ncbi:MAG: hypothetical protein ACK5UQ_17950 [Planctomycetota bacterium]